MGNNSENGQTTETMVIKERKRWLFFGLPFTFTTYRLGAKALTLRKGFFTTTEDDIQLFRVLDVSVRRSLFQKIVGIGSLTVMSTDKSHPTLNIKNIKRCRAFKEAIDARVEKERLRLRFRTGELIDNDLDVDDETFNDG